MFVVFLIAITILIYKSNFFKFQDLNSKYVVGIYILKVLSGAALIWVYSFYYQSRENADVFKYFDDGNIIYESLYDNPADYFKMLSGIGSDQEHLRKYYEECNFWYKGFNYDLYNDNRTVIRFNAFIRLFSFGNIYIHVLFINLLSFIGLIMIYRIVRSALSHLPVFFSIFTVFLLPGVLFWGSGILKEGILLFGFGLLIKGVYDSLKKLTVKSIIQFSIGIIILLLSKFYVLIAALPGIFSMIYLSRLKKFKFLGVMLIHILFFFAAAYSEYIIPGYSFVEILSNKQHDFINYANSLKDVGSLIKIPILESDFLSVIVNAPLAFYNTLFRPFLWESSSLMMLFSALENLLIILILILSIVFRRKTNLTGFVVFSISFVIILFVLSGLTTPVLGALVRYKIPALPFLFVFLFYFLDYKKLLDVVKR